jgi:hypothetical protein
VAAATVIAPDQYSQSLRNDGDTIYRNPFVSFVFSYLNVVGFEGTTCTVNFQIQGQNGAFFR